MYFQPLVTLHFPVHFQPIFCHLVFEEGKTVLTVPVVGLVLHPVEPGHDHGDGHDHDNEEIMIMMIGNTDQEISIPL